MREAKQINLFLTEEDYQKIKECDNHFHRAIMLFFANTGVRSAELSRLTFSDVYNDDWTLKNSFLAGKTFKREIPINETAKDCINIFHEEAKKRFFGSFSLETPLIISKKVTKLTREHLLTILRNFALKNDIKKLTPLMLRDYFAISLRKKGFDFKVIQNLIGDRSIVATYAKYGNISQDNIRDAVNSIG
jgi:site-specific recombinase XerD